jgi:uncharacterized protein DUF1206
MRRWAEPAARVGYTAKGLVYLVVGGLALRAAVGWGGRATDTRGALQTMGRQRVFGDLLLALVAGGLLAYAFWRFVQAVLDLDGKGGDVKGLLVRAGFLGSGLAYAGLALTAAGLGTGGGGGGRRDLVRTWTGRALADPDRWWLVASIGAGVVGAGLYQFYKAYSNKFEKRLRLAQVSADSRQWVRRVAKLGLTARGVTFVVIGWFLVRAGLTTDAGEARGLGGALRTLSQQDYGPWLLGGVGLGLAAYGVFAIVTGRYRQIG